MYKLYKTLENEQISLTYFGVFSDEITLVLINLFESYIFDKKQFKKVAKKAPVLITESFQNIIRHGILEEDRVPEIKNSKDFFQISIVADRIIITSANVVSKQGILKIEKDIEHLNALDSKELKQYYRDKLDLGLMSTKGGAGLGFIQMIRKSGLPLKKKTLPLSDEYSLFLLSIELPINENVGAYDFDLNLVHEFYDKYIENDILLSYKGAFSIKSNSNLIEMLDNNLLHESMVDPNNVKKLVLTIELIQNASKHGKVIDGLVEGLFTIRNIKNELYVECSNFVNKNDHDFLLQALTKIKEYSADEINVLYKEQLAKSYLLDDDNGGLGLYEIARLTQNEFTFNFEKVSDDTFFYTLKLKAV